MANKQEWRDTHFRIEGPAVFGLQAAFMENRIETGRPLAFDHSVVRTSDAGRESDIQVIRTSASVRWSYIVMHYQVHIKMANESVYITTACFNPNKAILNLLIESAERGVDVRIMMPGQPTGKEIAKVTGNESFDQLLDAGAELWYYQKTMLHAKIITVDGLINCIGSANFNHRSMFKDDEVNVVILDEEVAGQLNDHFDDDFAGSEKIEKGRWKQRNLFKRVKEK